MKDVKRGKLIVVDGTDCSGKETQCLRLIKRLRNDGVEVFETSFPQYDTPTGKIIGGPLLGKPAICDSYFGDEASKVMPKVASLYYAADRLYNIKPIKERLENGCNVILDRYTTSNMGFQAAKYDTFEKRMEMVKFLEKLEYDLLELPRPDEVIFLHMPYEQACILKAKREEAPDKVESDKKYLIDGERAYLEIAREYNFKTIECVRDGEIRSIEDINDELYLKVKEILNG